MNNCLFCDIANKKANSLILYEDDIVIVFLDIYPNCDGHTLVVPKKHYEDITEVDDKTLIHMVNIAKKYAKILMDKLSKKSVTYLINYGDSQKIKHLHLHILPNYGKKGTNLTPEEVYKIINNK